MIEVYIVEEDKEWQLKFLHLPRVGEVIKYQGEYYMITQIEHNFTSNPQIYVYVKKARLL